MIPIRLEVAKMTNWKILVGEVSTSFTSHEWFNQTFLSSLNLFHHERFEDVAFFDVVEVLNSDTTFISC